MTLDHCTVCGLGVLFRAHRSNSNHRSTKHSSLGRVAERGWFGAANPLHIAGRYVMATAIGPPSMR